MQEYFRVLDLDTGHERSVHEGELAHGNYRRLDALAVDPRTGEPIPPTFGDGKPVEDAEAAAQAATESPYTAKGVKKADLEHELAGRNAQRGDDEQIVVGGTGTIPDLVDALQADDATHSTTPGLVAGDAGPDAGEED